jgi:exosortase A
MSHPARMLSYHLIALSVILIVVLIAYLETFQSMVNVWLASDTFLHCFIIPPLSAYLIWKKRPELVQIPPRIFGPGVFLLLSTSTGWFLADLLGIQVGKHFAATAMIPAAAITFMGLSFSRAIAFPLGYLFFAVPFGEFWVPELMEITATFAIKLSYATGIPVFRDGRFLSIPGGDFEVAEACSGIRYLLATLALGTIFAYLNYRKAYKQLLFIVFAVVFAIAANGFRAYGIVALAHYSDMKLAVGVDHIIYGWLFFGFVIAILFLIGNRYRDVDSGDDNARSRDVPSIDVPQTSRIPMVIFVTAVAAVILGPLASNGLAATTVQKTKFSNGLPNSVSEWQGTETSTIDWKPTFIGAEQELLVRYVSSGAHIDVAVSRYTKQTQGSEVVNIRNSIFGNNGWERRNTRELSVRLADGTIAELLETTAFIGVRSRRFWYWYDVDGQIATSSTQVKFLEALSILKGRPAISSVIIISTVDNEGGREAISRFLQAGFDEISVCIDATVPVASCQLGLSRSSSRMNRE